MKGWDSLSKEEWKWKYRVTEGWQQDLECIVFGLEVRDQNGNIAAQIPDLSSEREFAEQAAQLFERERLEPIHLAEAAEDILAVGRVPL